MKKRKLKIKNILLLLLIIVFIFSVSNIASFYYDIYKSKDNNNKLIDEAVTIIDDKEEIIVEPVEPEDNEETKLDKEDTTEVIDEPLVLDKISVDFNKLYETNSDTVGWILYNNKKINNPIVHTTDNHYYLKHSFNKEINSGGAIFMDYRNSSFDDKNVVLFGHANSAMFGSLSNLFSDGYFNKKKNNYIQIVNSNNEMLIYQVFSYYITDVEEYYITTNFKDNNDFYKFVDKLARRSYESFNVYIRPTDKILTLSTCHGTGRTQKRRVVHAVRVKLENY